MFPVAVKTKITTKKLKSWSNHLMKWYMTKYYRWCWVRNPHPGWSFLNLFSVFINYSENCWDPQKMILKYRLDTIAYQYLIISHYRNDRTIGALILIEIVYTDTHTKKKNVKIKPIHFTFYSESNILI